MIKDFITIFGMTVIAVLIINIFQESANSPNFLHFIVKKITVVSAN